MTDQEYLDNYGIDEIKKAAYLRKGLPEVAHGYDILAYMVADLIYRSYARKDITQDEAEAAMSQMKMAWMKAAFAEMAHGEVVEECRNIIDRTELAKAAYLKSGNRSKEADAIVEAIDGVLAVKD